MGFTLGTVFNEGTDWEFTVSNETLASVVSGDGITEADIGPYCYCALYDARVVAMVQESSRATNDGLYPWATEYCPAYNTNNGSHPSKVKMNVSQKEQYPVTCYQRNILTYYGNIGGVIGHYLVMDIHDIKKWIMDFDVYPAYASGSVASTAGFPGYSGTAYVYSDSRIPRVTPYQPVGTPTADIYLMNVFDDGSVLWVGSLNPTAHSKEKLSNEYLPHQAWDTAWSAGDVYNTLQTGYIYQGGSPTMQGWSNFPDAEFPDPPGNTITFESFLECDDAVHSLIRVAGQYGNTQNPYITACEQGHIVKTLKDVHRVESWSGLLFKDNNIVYKPIIEGGIVTGFTSDMDIPSEWDDMTNVTGNNINPHPPSPTPSEGDDIDDHVMGAGTGISGMANLWLLTKGQLDDLHSAFNSAPGGFDPLQSVISCMGLGVIPTYVTSDIETQTNISIKKSDGTSWSTGVSGHIVGSQVSAFQFTGITVNRKYNNFLDFSPYAIHEIFLPMCGWLTLPDIAVDRSITVTYLPDIESLKCRAVVSVVDNSGNRCVLGEKDGIMGADVPFTNVGHSLFVGDAIVNSMNVAGEVITGAIGAGFTKTNAKGGTYRPYEGFTVGMGGTLPGAIGNAIVSGATNRTHYTTGNGTRVGFSDGENIQIKSTYHKIDKPDNYEHTVGLVCNKSGKLSTFTGFTVCDNPHITFSALEDEKNEIKSLLEQGVIL